MLFLTSSCGIRVISKPTLPLTILSCRYLYTSHIEVTNFNLFSLMHAASKFQLDHLQSKCAQFLRGKINNKNFASHGKEAVNFGSEEYVKMVQGFFGQNTSQLLKEDGLFGCPQKVISALCSNDEINCSELELFQFCITWEKRKCLMSNTEETPENLRSTLGDIIDKIRFSSMDNSDFKTNVIPMEVLTLEQIGSIIVTMGSGHTRTIDENLVSNFRLQTSTVLKSDEFKKLSLEGLVNLYSSEDIKCKELDVFTAAMEWASINKPKEQDFERVLDNIRFPAMSLNEFISKVVPEDVLSCEQIGQVVLQMKTKQKVFPYSDICREEKVKVRKEIIVLNVVF